MRAESDLMDSSWKTMTRYWTPGSGLVEEARNGSGSVEKRKQSEAECYCYRRRAIPVPTEQQGKSRLSTVRVCRK